MTDQQIKDYKKVQSIDILELWKCDGYSSIEEIPLKCAISDMAMIVCDAEANNFGDDTAKVVRMAKWFLRKYKIDERTKTNKIKSERIRLGLTQYQLAEITGIPFRTIQNWETGQRKCPEYVERLLLFYLEHTVKQEKG